MVGWGKRAMRRGKVQPPGRKMEGGVRPSYGPTRRLPCTVGLQACGQSRGKDTHHATRGGFPSQPIWNFWNTLATSGYPCWAWELPKETLTGPVNHPERKHKIQWPGCETGGNRKESRSANAHLDMRNHELGGQKRRWVESK